MSDEERIVDRTAARDAKAKIRTQQDRQRRLWAREGYDPERHWRDATGKGATSLIAGWMNDETEGGRTMARAQAFPTWLAHMDLFEMIRKVRRVYDPAP